MAIMQKNFCNLKRSSKITMYELIAYFLFRRIVVSITDERSIMNSVQFTYKKSCSIPQGTLGHLHAVLLPKIHHIKNSLPKKYETEYAALYAPFDSDRQEKIITLAQAKKALNPALFIIIGIGGSNLGAAAVIQALYGTLYATTYQPSIFFADTLDSDYIATLLQKTENTLKNNETVLVNVISKSGTTTETIANFALFYDLIKKYHPHTYHDFFVITTDEHSPLWQFSQQETFTALAIPAHIGGRYSVFSAVGLFPLAFLGVDIAQLCAGAQHTITHRTQEVLDHNPAAINACILFSLYQKGYYIHDTFLFLPALENLGKWYRQLLGESIGKMYDTNNSLVNVGITPTVSIGSTDLHSVGQLYLSGPNNIFTTFVSVKQTKHTVSTPAHEQLTCVLPLIAHKSLQDIMNAILEGTLHAYQQHKRPFVHYTLPEINEFYLGEWMGIKMLEIIYLAHMLNINPFDQPQVEDYKKITKEILLTKR